MYVTMVDNFMTGWGNAADKTAYLVIECDTQYQAECIEKAAEDRGEMRRIRIVDTPPEEEDHMQVTYRHFNDLWGSWKKFYVKENDHE